MQNRFNGLKRIEARKIKLFFSSAHGFIRGRMITKNQNRFNGLQKICILTNIWIHLIFSTKDRRPLIDDSFELNLHKHIKNKLIEDFDSHVECINGYNDHIHILIKQSQNFSIKDIVKNIKGESSHWINSSNLTKEKFAWQSGYSALSISIDKIFAVRTYIENQKEHHKKIPYLEEIRKYLKIYGLDEKTVETILN